MLLPILRAAPRPFALVDFPNHSNCGDSAIWLGERRILADADLPVSYACDVHNYSAARLRRRIGEGAILLHGGGNFGDLWPQHHLLREQVIRDFPDRPIVQLPQTMFFRSGERRTATARLLSTHGNVTLLCRDQASHEFATRHFDAVSHLAPDSALALTPAVAPPPSESVLLLARADGEQSGAGVSPEVAPGRRVDWLGSHWRDAGWTPEFSLLHRLTGAATWDTSRPRAEALAQPLVQRLYDRLASERVEFATRLLGGARVVVTDRLHAHILCLLIGVPHVVVDTGYGKLSQFVTTWTQDSPLVRLAGSNGEARMATQELLAATRGD